MKRVLVSSVAESFGMSNVTTKELENVNGGISEGVVIALIGAGAVIAAAVIQSCDSKPNCSGTYCSGTYNPTYNYNSSSRRC